jgi:ribose transport system substrate-binding protein
MLKKKGKVLVIMVAVMMVVAFSLGACGGGASEDSGAATEDASASDDSATGEATTEDTAAEIDGGGEYVIGFSNCSTANTWRMQLEAEFKQEADQFVADGRIKEYYMLNANGDVQKQIADVQDLIAKKVDAILVTCVNPDGINNVLQEAKDAGIVVINFDQWSSADFFDAKIIGDNYTIGYQCAEFICDNVEDNAKILQLDGIAGSAGSEAARQGMEDAIKDKGKTLDIVADLACDWDYATAKTAVEDALVANPQIDGVLSQGGAMTQATIEVFNAQGRPLVPMSGEGSNGFLKVWKENQGKDNFKSFAFVIPTWQGLLALDAAVEILNGQQVEKDQKIIDPGVTEDTLDDFVRPELSDSLWVPTKLTDENIKALFTE